MAEKAFYDRFRENMDLLGLRAPRSWFESAATTTATIGTIAKAIQQYGHRVTVRELVLTVPVLASAGAAAEFSLAVGAVFATFYLAACLGSLLVATGQSVSYESLARAYHQSRLPPAVWVELPHLAVRMNLVARGQR